MAAERATTRSAGREYSGLRRLHTRIADQLEAIRKELESPSTHRLLRAIRQRAGSQAADRLEEVLGGVESAIRALKLFGSELEREMVNPDPNLETDLVAGLPGPLARFLAERRKAAECRIEVGHDPIRGWVIRWKEYGEDGAVRGFGQFSERPYAWLEE